MDTFAGRTASWVVLMLLFGFVGESAAQPASLTAGYQPLKVPDNWINAGFNFNVAVPAKDQLGIVSEFGLAHQGSSGRDPVRSNTFHFGAGPRWSWLRARAVPFVQILAGGEVTQADIPVTGGGKREDSDAAFMLQPGAGVYVPVSDRWGVVGQTDVRSVFFDGETDQQFRIVLGARFGLR